LIDFFLKLLRVAVQGANYLYLCEPCSCRVIWATAAALPTVLVNTLEVEPLIWNWNEILGLWLGILGMLCEMMADLQKSEWHRRHADRPDRFSRLPPVCATGLWRISRHPNHFGDLCVQWGVWMMVTDVTPMVSVVGPVICTLIVFVSDGGMRMIENERELQYFSYESYHAYIDRTSLFWPLMPSLYTRVPDVLKKIVFFSQIYAF